MNQLFRWAACAVAALALGACAHSTPRARPHDPWVFRSVLDDRPRMLTAALHEDLWVAYDLTNASLYKAWRGGVNFAGSVYNTVHGPQPTTMGPSYLTGAHNGSPWRVRGPDGVLLEPRAKYLGYEVVRGQLALHYALDLERSPTILVTERPEIEPSQRGRVRFVRTFETSNVPNNVTIVFVEWLGSPLNLDLPMVEIPTSLTRDLQSNATTRIECEFDVLAATNGDPVEKSELRVVALPQSQAQPVLSPPTSGASGAADLEILSTIVAPFIDGEADAVWAVAAAMPIALRVAGTIGGEADASGVFQALYDVDHLYLLFTVRDEARQNDSTLPWHDDGCEIFIDGGNERQNFLDDNDAQLIFGAGDASFWCDTEVSRHPGVQHATQEIAGGYRIEARVPWANVGARPAAGMRFGFEVHIDDDDDGLDGDGALAWHSAAADTYSDPSKFASAILSDRVARIANEVPAPREPGLAFRGYSIGRTMSELVRLVPGQTPNVSRVISTVDLAKAEDFGGLDLQFYAQVTGFLRPPSSGSYTFRLTSDDGARLWIDNQPVIDLDGDHAIEARDATTSLDAEEHTLRIAYFENSGDQMLRLEWRDPTSGAFVVVPASWFSTPAGEVRVTAPGQKRFIEPRLASRPGDGTPLVGVHPSYDMSSIRPEGFEPRVGGMDFLPDGRLAVCTWDHAGRVYLLDGVQTGDARRVTIQEFASGLAEPLGLKVVDGRIFVLQKQELTELIDRDGVDRADEYRCVAAGWGVTANFHEFAFGLAYQDGFFYATLATAINAGGACTQPQNPDRGKVLRIAADGRFEFIASGLRTPNGIGIGVDDELFVSDNQGDWLPASKVVHVRPGAFYGVRAVDPVGDRDRDETPPCVWLPQNEIGNSPAEPVVLNDGPYRGQMLCCDVTYGGLQRIFLESVAGQYQGAVFRFSQGFEAGLNRCVWGPDGALYVGGIGSTGNWSQEGKKRFGLERLQYNGKSTFELLAVRACANGFELEFTEPLPVGVGWNPVDYEVRTWRYVPTHEYGGPKVDERELRVESATVDESRTRIFVELVGLERRSVVYLRLLGPWASANGELPLATETWYTLNEIPLAPVGTARPSPFAASPNVLTAAERAAGFELLFDGETLAGWQPYTGENLPATWRVEDDAITLEPRDGAAIDLMTANVYGDFELRFEWKISEAGNSGVFYRVAAGGHAPWATGPEYQILDSSRHADGRHAKTSAAACYALYPPRFRAERAPGLYNESRIVVADNSVEHWLNGHCVVRYQLKSAEWVERVSASKFSAMPGHGREARGHIVLQDHGDRVWYRSLRIRAIESASRSGDGR
ncbi:MAG: family 16 glycoside hydrolase [Planctomycetota bacterium]